LFKNINKMIEIGRKTNAPIVIFGKKWKSWIME
jgi:hypothetical protein